MPLTLVLFLNLLGQAAPTPEPVVGPRAGTLVIDGGGENPAADRAFVALAGGPDAEIVLIPTAERRGDLTPTTSKGRNGCSRRGSPESCT